jgi:predicted dinucleotide-binding enzyme
VKFGVMGTGVVGHAIASKLVSLGHEVGMGSDVRVVKSLNTVNADVMGNPGIVPGRHTIFVGGNDTAAREQVVDLLETFGWPRSSVVDLGDISTAGEPRCTSRSGSGCC